MMHNIRPAQLDSPKNPGQEWAFKNIKRVMEDVDVASDILIRADNKDGVDDNSEKGVVSFPYYRAYTDDKTGIKLGSCSLKYDSETKKVKELYLEVEDGSEDNNIHKFDKKSLFGREKTVMMSLSGTVTVDNKTGKLSFKGHNERDFADFLGSVVDAMMKFTPVM